ncbi:4'-phosphopantetheinyl transferase superfamily protein [Micropruina sp.]|uniref:4'-phosphopantetheinyl transferase family protein n=1 Tax=Micropruina sp. TaxID=2737536 RepID=UPI0026255210|nr:4'-phosphopantetheinyl transferase superfamily protein [Micropruina sp.]
MTIARFVPVEEVLGDDRLAGVELSEAETTRWRRLRFEVDRDAYRAAHLLARLCAGDLLDISPSRVCLEQHCPRCGATGHGRPSIVGESRVQVSLSHTRGHVAAVAATAECGIDVERIAGSIPRNAVTAHEQTWLDTATDPLLDFTRLWVRKEALVKVGVADEPGRIDVVGESGPADRVGRFALTDWTGSVDQSGRPTALGCLALAD